MDTGGNIAIVSVAAPRVVIAQGAFIVSLTDSTVSNGAGGNYILVTIRNGAANTMFDNNGVNYKVKIQGQTGQANATGIWTVTVVDNTHFRLNINTSTGLPSAYNLGSAHSPNTGEVLWSSPRLNAAFIEAGIATYSGMDNMVLCKVADEAGITAGQICDQTYVDQINALKPKWLRWMDLIGVQASLEADFLAADASEQNYLFAV